MKLFRYIPRVIFSISSGYFLTSIIDKTTIDTAMQFILIFCYFVSLSLLLSFCFNKWFKIEDKKVVIKAFIISLIIAGLMVGANFTKIVVAYKPTAVVIESRDQDTEFKESDSIWISHIYLDEKSISLSKFQIGYGWKYIKEWDDIVSTVSKPEPLNLSFPSAESIEIRFAYYDQFAETTYIRDGGVYQLITLTPDNEKGFSYNVISNYSINSSTSILFCLSALALFCGIFFFLLSAIRRYRSLYILIQLILCFTIFFIFDELYFGFSIQIAMIIASLFCGKYLLKAINSFKLRGITKKFTSLIFMFNLYFTFACVGHPLFLARDMVEIDAIKIAKFLLCFCYFLPYNYITLYIVENIKKKIKNSYSMPNNKQLKEFKLMLFIITFSILFIISLGFYPGNITSDGVDQWTQALGIWPINDAHPAAHTLLLRLCAFIWENPYLVVIIQILAFSLLISNLLTLFYKNGLSKKLLIIFAVIISIIPNNFMMLTLISKNIPFALAIWWLMYLIIQMFDSPIEFFRRPSKYILMIIALALIELLRHNGFLAVISVSILLFVLALKPLRMLKVRPLIIILGVFVVTQVVQGPVYAAFGVKGATSTVSGPLLSPLGSAIKNNVELPDDILLTMEKIAPLEQWKEIYYKYNDDKFYFANPRPNFESITTNEAFKIYINFFGMHPDIVIKDRLDKMNLIWNVVQPIDGSNNRYAVGIWPPSSITPEILPKLLVSDYARGEGAYYRENPISKPLLFVLNYSSGISIFDTVLWRNGIYVIIYLLLILFSVYNKRYNIIWISLPAVATLITYVLMMGWPIYQYLWFFPFSVIILILYTLTDSSSSTK